MSEYLLLKGEVEKIDLTYVMDKNEEPKDEEYEDAFLNVLVNQNHLLGEKKRSLFGKNTFFKMKDKLIPIGKYQVVSGIVNVDELRQLSKKA